MTARVELYDHDQMLSSCPIFTITVSLSMKPMWTQKEGFKLYSESHPKVLGVHKQNEWDRQHVHMRKLRV